MPYYMKHICRVLVLSYGSEYGVEGLLCLQISVMGNSHINLLRTNVVLQLRWGYINPNRSFGAFFK